MKTQNLVFGASSGKLGNVVASRVYGDNIVRSKPLEVYNPRTAKQVNMRTIMAAVVAIAKVAILYLAITKRTARTGRSKKMSAYAYLIKDILAAKTGTAPDIALESTGITLGTGDLYPTVATLITIDVSDNAVTCIWPTDSQNNQTINDTAMVILINLSNNKVYSIDLNAKRQEGFASSALPAGFASVGNDVAAFLAFEDPTSSIWDAPVSVKATVNA